MERTCQIFRSGDKPTHSRNDRSGRGHTLFMLAGVPNVGTAPRVSTLFLETRRCTDQTESSNIRPTIRSTAAANHRTVVPISRVF